MASKAKSQRHVLLGVAHKAAKLLGMNDDERRALQKRIIGVDSLKDAPLEHLRVLVWHYKKLGADVGIPFPELLGGEGTLIDPRPTRMQLGRIEKLSVDLGWNGGLLDERLQNFCKHTCHVDGLRFLRRQTATYLINGLQKLAARV